MYAPCFGEKGLGAPLKEFSVNERLRLELAHLAAFTPSDVLIVLDRVLDGFNWEEAARYLAYLRRSFEGLSPFLLISREPGFLDAVSRVVAPFGHRFPPEASRQSSPPKNGREVTASAWLELLLQRMQRQPVLAVLEGCSGSGKSSALQQLLDEIQSRRLPWKAWQAVTLSQKRLDLSMAATLGVDRSLAKLFAATAKARVAGLKPADFTLGQSRFVCTACKGTGCEVSDSAEQYAAGQRNCSRCKGKRFEDPLLNCTYKAKSIGEVYQLSAEKTLQLFAEEDEIALPLSVLQRFELGQMRLGDPAGECTRRGRTILGIAAGLNFQAGRQIAALYLFDDFFSKLAATDFDELGLLLRELVAGGNSVIVVDNSRRLAAYADLFCTLCSPRTAAPMTV